jgi:hypothetical protein
MASKSSARAYMAATRLARRVGLGADNVEKVRRDLKRIGLLGSAARPGHREASWWPMFPTMCHPASERPNDEEVFGLAALLDHHIRRTATGDVAEAGTPKRRHPRPTTGVKQSASDTHDVDVLQYASNLRSEGVAQYATEGREVGGKGAQSSLRNVGTTLPASFPPLKDGEVGSFVNEKDEGGVDPNSDPRSETMSWREIPVIPRGSSRPIPIGELLRAAYEYKGGS